MIVINFDVCVEYVRISEETEPKTQPDISDISESETPSGEPKEVKFAMSFIKQGQGEGKPVRRLKKGQLDSRFREELERIKIAEIRRAKMKKMSGRKFTKPQSGVDSASGIKEMSADQELAVDDCIFFFLFVFLFLQLDFQVFPKNCYVG